MQKTFRIVTYFYIDCSNAQLIFTHVDFVDLLSSCTPPLGHSFDGPIEESLALFGVADIYGKEDLEFPVLLDTSVDEDGIVVERGPENGREHECGLRCGYV
jgi:hypothetical protein